MILSSFRTSFVVVIVFVIISKSVFDSLGESGNADICDKNMLYKAVQILKKEQIVEEHLLYKLNDLTKRSSSDFCTIESQCIKEVIPKTEKFSPYYPRSCAEAMKAGDRDGVRKLHVTGYEINPFYAYCLKDTSDNGSYWTVILRREAKKMSFHRNWDDYKHGFGCLFSEHSLGLDFVHAMTNYQQHELWIIMRNSTGKEKAKYSHFLINNEANGYMLKSVGNFTGYPNADNSLKSSVGYKFSTYDIDYSENQCSKNLLKGAWWFFGPMPRHEKQKCSHCCLTNSIEWEIKGKLISDFTTALMMIRPYDPNN